MQQFGLHFIGFVKKKVYNFLKAYKIAYLSINNLSIFFDHINYRIYNRLPIASGLYFVWYGTVNAIQRSLTPLCKLDKIYFI